MYKVMIRDNMAPVAVRILEATNAIEVVVDNDKSRNDPAGLADVIGDFDALAVRGNTKVDERVLAKAGRLKVIGRAGMGVDNIDVATATRQGIVVMNAPGGNTITTAEHAISLLLALARNIPQATASMRAGKWEKKAFKGVEVSGKILGVVGFGNIGRIVAQKARGLGMNVMAADPFVRPDAMREMDVESVSLDELLSRADFISLHVPRLKDTINLINAAAIEKMKPQARLINCARGDVVNLSDLLAALENGRVAGAALDVYPSEPPDPGLAILQHPNVILTPHLGASTEEAQIKVAEMIARQIADYLLNGDILHAVNMPSVSREVMARIRPYFEIAEKMGAIMGQLARQFHDLTITYCGEIADIDTRPLTHAVLKGVLSASTDNPVNYVSAPAMAQSRGIRVHEVTSKEKRDFRSLIRLKLEDAQGGPDEIWGTVFSDEHPRIVRFGRIYMDAIPEGAMLVIQNHDQPGVIGNVGTTLGRHHINIGRYQLGRLADQALCMVNIDTPADEAVLKDLRELPNIISVHQVRLDALSG